MDGNKSWEIDVDGQIKLHRPTFKLSETASIFCISTRTVERYADQGLLDIWRARPNAEKRITAESIIRFYRSGVSI